MDLIIETRSLSDIHPYPNNPRKNDNAVDAVAESIRQCGYIAPIIVDENGVILAGHTRYKALQKLGRSVADVVVKTGLSDEQKRKYRILDNKTAELAEWDYDLLKQELENIDFAELENFDFAWDFPDPVFDDAVDDDYEPNPPADPKSKPGEIYQLGKHRLMCGDSTRAEDVEVLMARGKASLLLTDPPYNVDYTGATKEALKIVNDNMEDGEFRQFLVDALACANAVMNPGAAFYIWHADSEGYNFRGACRDVGWKVRQCLIWAKNSMVLGRQDYQWKHEPCLYGWKDGAPHYWGSDRKQTTLLEFDKPSKSELHPTMKPIPLFDYQIQNSSRPGDIVLDLFAGSGTTVMACEQNGRKAYCMEYDPRYVDVIIDRWEQFTGEKAVLIREK